MFALCDQRSFYASCEAVFRPDLREQPICVLSNNDGCVVALNEFAKKLGVKKFEPYFKQRALLKQHRVNVFSSNYALYGEISQRIMSTLKAHTPSVEVYSIDEGFCGLSGIENDELKPLGKSLRQKVWREQRIPMGVSIAPTKTLAKLGQYATKQYPQIEGVAVLLTPDQWQWLARRTSLREVWGIGQGLGRALQERGAETAYDVMHLEPHIAREVGGLPLLRTVTELQGKPCIPLELEPPPKQSLICSRSFGRPVESLSSLLAAVSGYAYRASEKLRDQNSLAGHLTVRLVHKSSDGTRLMESLGALLPGGEQDARKLVQVANDLVHLLYNPETSYVKAGVELLDVRLKSEWSCSLLENPKPLRSNTMSVLDDINRKFGRHTVGLGRMLGAADSAMKQQWLSPSYLTQWEDLPRLY